LSKGTWKAIIIKTTLLDRRLIDTHYNGVVYEVQYHI
jgi:hypothetical protein